MATAVSVCQGCRRRGVTLDPAGHCADCAMLAAQRTTSLPPAFRQTIDGERPPDEPTFRLPRPEPRQARKPPANMPENIPEPPAVVADLSLDFITPAEALAQVAAYERKQETPSAPPERRCARCSFPLGANAYHNRKYCDACNEILPRERMQKSRAAGRQPVPRRPMVESALVQQAVESVRTTATLETTERRTLEVQTVSRPPKLGSREDWDLQWDGDTTWDFLTRRVDAHAHKLDWLKSEREYLDQLITAEEDEARRTRAAVEAYQGVSAPTSERPNGNLYHRGLRDQLRRWAAEHGGAVYLPDLAAALNEQERTVYQAIKQLGGTVIEGQAKTYLLPEDQLRRIRT